MHEGMHDALMQTEAKHIPHNVRLEIQKHHASRPGYIISDQTTGDYQKKLASSVFCLAPSGKGGGWGMRFGSAVLTGCIPVIIMDNSTEVFAELLPYDKFSVRVAERDIPRLHETLAALQREPGRVAAMQAELACTYKLFLWTRYARPVRWLSSTQLACPSRRNSSRGGE
jgi:hypothetical protein